MANAAADKQWEEANCVMHCSDENLPAGEKGQCIMKDMRCNGKKDCTGGEDEAECPCKLTLNNCIDRWLILSVRLDLVIDKNIEFSLFIETCAVNKNAIFELFW